MSNTLPNIIKKLNKQIAFLLFALAYVLSIFQAPAQNSVGIGTDTIHASAVLQIDDSARGLLIPRTDTSAINAYVSSLFPNPGIADGLMIFDVNANNFYYYDGTLKKWVPVNRRIGARGPTGITGITGLLGPMGRSTHWRDSAFADPVYQPGDSCGDYYHETNTGFIWYYDCDSNDWVGPIARWRNLGYGEHILQRSSSLVYAPMPASQAAESMFVIPGLSALIRVPPDMVAHVTVTSQGTIQKRFANDSSFNYVKFDFFLTDLQAPPGSYLGRTQTVGIAPNIPLAGNPSGDFDKVGWNITTSFKLEGKLSPKGAPLPSLDVLSWRIETHTGQLFTVGHPQPIDTRSDVIIVDGGNGAHGLWENYAVMNVMIVFERNKNAAYPE